MECAHPSPQPSPKGRGSPESDPLSLWERVRVRESPRYQRASHIPVKSPQLRLWRGQAGFVVECPHPSPQPSPKGRGSPESDPLSLWERVRVRESPRIQGASHIPVRSSQVRLRRGQAGFVFECAHPSPQPSPKGRGRSESDPLSLWERVRVRESPRIQRASHIPAKSPPAPPEAAAESPGS